MRLDNADPHYGFGAEVRRLRKRIDDMLDGSDVLVYRHEIPADMQPPRTDGQMVYTLRGDTLVPAEYERVSVSGRSDRPWPHFGHTTLSSRVGRGKPQSGVVAVHSGFEAVTWTVANSTLLTADRGSPSEQRTHPTPTCGPTLRWVLGAKSFTPEEPENRTLRRRCGPCSGPRRSRRTERSVGARSCRDR